MTTNRNGWGWVAVVVGFQESKFRSAHKTLARTVIAGLAIVFLASDAVAQDPIIHYTFDGDTGTTATDSATADGQQDMTITGSFINDAERGDVLNATGGGSLAVSSTAKNYTFAGWYKGTAVGHYYDQSNPFRRLSVEYSVTAVSVYDGDYRGTTVTNANDGTWHHLAWVIEDNGASMDTFTFYLDGVDADGSINLPNGFGNLGGTQKLFSHNSVAAQILTGLHDDVRIYDRALSAAEVAALAGVTIVPTVSTLEPADGATVATPASLTVTFDDDIATNTTGSITITNIAAGGTADIIPVGSGELVVSGADLVITPTTPALSNGTHYAVLIDTNAIKNLAGNFFAGFTNTVDWDWDFTTTTPDTDGPTLVLPTSPADNATDVGVGVNFEATFNENIAAGSGNIIITNLTDGTATNIAASDGEQVSISTSNLTINPTSSLLGSKSYAILIETNAITDNPGGNPFAGITNIATWNFATETAEPNLIIRYTFDGDSGSTAIDSGTVDGQQNMTITGSFTNDAERGDVLNATGGGSFVNPSTSNNYTFAGWYKGTAEGHWYDQDDKKPRLTVEYSTGFVSAYDSIENAYHDTTVTNANDGTWHHLAWVLEDNGTSTDTFTFYLDGVDADGPIALPNGVGTLKGTQKLFSYNGGTSQYLTGLHDDVRIYDRALSAAEVAALADYTIVPKGTMIMIR